MRYRILTRALSVFALLAAVVATSPAQTQRVATYDFSTGPPKERTRPPKPMPPDVAMNQTGRCGGILGNPPVRVSLVSLDKTEYAIGDDVVFTITISNTSETPQRVPIAYNLADVEPPDVAEDYKYEPMEIWLHLVNYTESGEKQFLSTLVLTLYGSDNRPDTQIDLKKGESIEVRGRAKLENTSASGRHFNADSEVYSTIRNVTQKIPKMTAGVFSWRGDEVRFQARTQYEFVGCLMYEMSHGRPTGLTVDLLPARSAK
jgi:hypothetical protein